VGGDAAALTQQYRAVAVPVTASFGASGSDTSPAAARRNHPEWMIPADAFAQQAPTPIVVA
jgi:hypothetical protein